MDPRGRPTGWVALLLVGLLVAGGTGAAGFAARPRVMHLSYFSPGVGPESVHVGSTAAMLPWLAICAVALLVVLVAAVRLGLRVRAV